MRAVLTRYGGSGMRSADRRERGSVMTILIVAGLFGLYLALQLWILPHFGVKT